MTTIRKGLGAATAFCIVVAAMSFSVARADIRPGPLTGAPCSSVVAAGGDWPMYGHDLANSRAQAAETGLTAVKAATLLPAWRYDSGRSSTVVGLTAINGTPIVSRGCVFVGDSAGYAVALDADTGREVWSRHIDAFAPPNQGGGTFTSSPAVVGDRVIFVVNQLGSPFAVALDVSTGQTRWISPPLVADAGSFTNASPVVSNGVVFVGFSEPEGVVTAHGGFALLDATAGSLLARTYSIPPVDWSSGYGGGGIWSSAAVDTSHGYAYVGTGNPYSKQTEHPRTNAILKVDVDRSRPTFGSVIASYKGDIDQFVHLLNQLAKPTCALLPENPIPPVPVPAFVLDINQIKDSYACLQLDLDFGGSPNLITGGDGSLLVGELQKSGVYHVVRASDLAPVDKVLAGVSCLVCNGASTAYDSNTRTVFADVTPGTSLVSFGPTSGTLHWYSPVADAIHYEPPALAAGVVYTVDSLGFLDAYDATLGVPLLRRPLVLDGATDAVGALVSSGVSVANHMVYVAAGSHLIAYRSLLSGE